jgi:hypothetical protein
MPPTSYGASNRAGKCATVAGEHQSISIPARRGDGEASPLRACDLASISNRLECSLERLAVDDERGLIAKVWLLVLDTHA